MRWCWRHRRPLARPHRERRLRALPQLRARPSTHREALARRAPRARHRVLSRSVPRRAPYGLRRAAARGSRRGSARWFQIRACVSSQGQSSSRLLAHHGLDRLSGHGFAWAVVVDALALRAGRLDRPRGRRRRAWRRSRSRHGPARGRGDNSPTCRRRRSRGFSVQRGAHCSPLSDRGVPAIARSWQR